MASTRYLLSHNHDIPDQVAPSLSLDEFIKVFEQAAPSADTQVIGVEHPHWRCEVRTHLSPQEMGQFLAGAMKTFREHLMSQPLEYKILILGGLKTTPATSENPAALQPNEWGVDIVETIDDAAFLAKINWAGMTGGRDPQEIIQVII